MQLHIAHFSDLHYADETLPEVDRCFTYAVDEAIRERVDVAIITGDTTDHALNAHSPALAALARQIRRLADHCPVLMLQGTFSHEPPGFLSLFPLFGGKHPVHVADAIGQVALTGTGQWIASNGWRFDIPPDDMRLLCTCIPTLNKAALAAAFGPVDAAFAMGDQLARLLAGYAPGHLTVRQSDVPVVVLSHGTVHGCLTEHGVPMAGTDHEFTAGALFSAQASAIMLGHIHKHQVWDVDGRCIAYPGSIGRFHYGEEGDKGFLSWHVGPNCSTATLRPTPARQTYDIVFDGAPDLEALTQFSKSHELTGASVRVRWQVLEEERNVIDRARLAEILAGAGSLKLEGRIIPINRTRAAGMAREHSIPRQIEQWSQAAGVSPQAILSCLDQLTKESPETIAAHVLQAHGLLDIQEAVETN